MAVTITHGYAPIQADHYVEYEYTVAVDDEYDTQLGAPAYYDGVMQFSGGDIYFTQNDTVCDMTECEFTDTSDNVRRYYVEYDSGSGNYYLRYRINGDPPTVITSSRNQITFGWYAPSGATWNNGIMPGYQASIGGRAKYISGTQTIFYNFGGATVRVETRVSQPQTNKTYKVTETVATTP